ncbi:kallikrein-8 isoform X3 [Microtus oregoni]|nr:kallikrein-8 isoform X3 [Microtus oregoni]
MGRPPPCATQTWILLFLLMGAWAGLTRAQGSKVLEGQECEPHSQPWQTALFQGPRLVCGGVLVGDKWVLTAAHCKKQKYSVRLGDHSLQNRDAPEQEIQVAQSIQHPCYNNSNPEDHSHDVMLVRMRRSANLGPKVKPIKLANLCPKVGQKCVISGWGTVTSPRENFPDTLNCAEVEIFSQNKCEKAYPGKVTEGMVCAGSSNGADTCQRLEEDTRFPGAGVTQRAVSYHVVSENGTSFLCKGIDPPLPMCVCFSVCLSLSFS